MLVATSPRRFVDRTTNVHDRRDLEAEVLQNPTQPSEVITALEIHHTGATVAPERAEQGEGDDAG